MFLIKDKIMTKLAGKTVKFLFDYLLEFMYKFGMKIAGDIIGIWISLKSFTYLENLKI